MLYSSGVLLLGEKRAVGWKSTDERRLALRAKGTGPEVEEEEAAEEGDEEEEEHAEKPKLRLALPRLMPQHPLGMHSECAGQGTWLARLQA
eukprot:2483931-Rhodomonas_salina.1